MSKPLDGAFTHVQNNAFVSSSFATDSPLGVCLKAVSEPASPEAVKSAKSELNTLLLQISDTLTVIADHQNAIYTCPAGSVFSDERHVGSALDLIASMVRLSVDINTKLNAKEAGHE